MKTKNLKNSGILFIIGGIAFIFAYFFSQQLAYTGVAVCFILIGLSFIIKSNQTSNR